MADEEQKTEHINLKVAGQDGSVVQFKIKKVSSNIYPPFYRQGSASRSQQPSFGIVLPTPGILMKKIKPKIFGINEKFLNDSGP